MARETVKVETQQSAAHRANGIELRQEGERFMLRAEEAGVVLANGSIEDVRRFAATVAALVAKLPRPKVQRKRKAARPTQDQAA